MISTKSVKSVPNRFSHLISIIRTLTECIIISSCAIPFSLHRFAIFSSAIPWLIFCLVSQKVVICSLLLVLRVRISFVYSVSTRILSNTLIISRDGCDSTCLTSWIVMKTFANVNYRQAPARPRIKSLLLVLSVYRLRYRSEKQFT